MRNKVKNIAILTIFTMFLTLVCVVSHMGDKNKVNDNEKINNDVKPVLGLYAGISKDLWVESEIINVVEKSKTESTMSTMSGTIDSDETIEDLIKEPIEESVEESIEEDNEDTVDKNEDETIEIIIEEPITESICKNRWGITLTEDEINLLGRIVMLESGGEGNKGQQAVVEVIFNRMIEDDFKGSLYEVLSAKGQFSTWKNRNSNAANPSERVMTNIHKVLNGETNILPFKTVYFATRALNKRVQIKIGGHVFCNK